MINIVPLNLSNDKLAEIANYLLDKFDFSVTARANQVDGSYKRWQDNYAAVPREKVRTTPFPNASNFVPQLIRMHTDILSARICGILFSCKPFWRVKSWLKDLKHESLDSLNEWLEYTSFSDMQIFAPLDCGIFQTAKTGTCIFKLPWVDQSFATLDAEGRVQLCEFEGLQLHQIPFDDFYPWPLTVRDLSQVKIKFHRIRLTKEDIEWRKQNAKWDEAACNALIQTPATESSAPKRETEAQSAGINLTVDVSCPFNVIEAWFEYPIDNQYNYKLIFTLNPKRRGKEAILRSVYNFYKNGLDPFVDMRFAPRDDLFYGYSIPELLEQSQEEQAQIHNARRDANTIANVPGWKKKMYGNVPNPAQEWYPGKVFEVEQMEDLEQLQFGGNYNSMIEEEQYLLQLAERYTGIQTPMQGFGAGAMEGKRGIYSSGGTMALLAEGNKRLDVYIRRSRYAFHGIGNRIFQSYKEFRPNGLELDAFGEQAAELKRIFNIQEPKEFRGLFFDIGAADSGANRELDRQNLLLMANTMASYYRQIVESSSMLAQLSPEHPLYNILLAVLGGAKDLADRLLFQFEIGDRKRLLPDVQQILQGGPAPDGYTQPSGMPEAEGDASFDGIQNLSTQLTAITGGRVS
jgi:hypothetical protein